jgi:MFS family permease
MCGDQPAPSTRSNLAGTFRALRSRNYRLYFCGQGLSVIGTWIQQVAMGWLVYRLTNSALMLGVIGFAGQVPSFFLTPIAGVLADRLSRRHVLIFTQSLAMLQAFVLGVLVVSGAIRVWHVVAMSAFLGVVNAFDFPTRQSFTVEMVEDRRDIGNVIALNSSLFSSARLIGPTIAGVMIKLTGEGVCFLVNGASYLAVILALVLMRTSAGEARMEHGHMLRGLMEGVSYAVRSPAISTVLIFVAGMSLFAMPYGVLMPVLAKSTLGGGPETLGWLLGGGGAGAMIGALFLAARSGSEGLGKTAVVATGIFGGGLIALSLSRSIPLSTALMVLTGLGMTVQMACSNTVVQTVVEDSKRGRIMSLFVMSHMGVAPFGALLAGALAQRIGAPGTLLVAGACSIACAGLFASRLAILQRPEPT